jgi:hypothetical protein
MYWAMSLRNTDVRCPELVRDAERKRLAREAYVSHGTTHESIPRKRAPRSETRKNETLLIDEGSMMAERL